HRRWARWRRGSTTGSTPPAGTRVTWCGSSSMKTCSPPSEYPGARIRDAPGLRSPGPDPVSGGGPVPVAHQFPALELVGLAPGLEPLGTDTEVEVAGELARVEARLGGEGVAGLGGDVGGGLRRVHRALDENQIAGGADAEAGPAGGLEVAAGHTGSGGGYQHGGAAPEEGQRHQVRGAASRGGGGAPGVDVVGEPVERVVLALPGGAGGRCHAGSLLTGRGGGWRRGGRYRSSMISPSWAVASWVSDMAARASGIGMAARAACRGPAECRRRVSV